MATGFLWQYQFTSTVEKEIWRLHADGLSLRDIAIELQGRGYRLFKDKIHGVVKNLREIMLGRKLAMEGPQLSFTDVMKPKVRKDE